MGGSAVRNLEQGKALVAPEGKAEEPADRGERNEADEEERRHGQCEEPVLLALDLPGECRGIGSKRCRPAGPREPLLRSRRSCQGGPAGTRHDYRIRRREADAHRRARRGRAVSTACDRRTAISRPSATVDIGELAIALEHMLPDATFDHVQITAIGAFKEAQLLRPQRREPDWGQHWQGARKPQRPPEEARLPVVDANREDMRLADEIGHELRVVAARRVRAAGRSGRSGRVDDGDRGPTWSAPRAGHG